MVLSPTRRTDTRFLVLTPARFSMPANFSNVASDNRRHDKLLAEMQRFRGAIYASDGAIRQDELADGGRHKTPEDEHCWHILSVDPRGRIAGCVRFLEQKQARRFDDLFVRNAAVARSSMASRFREAVEGEMSRARSNRLTFGEVGGWAVAEDYRCTIEPLRIILATYGLLELLGGCLGVATATFRHNSSTILRRIGLTTLASQGEELPPYYDSRYGCQMEMLRFDSRFPSARYRGWVEAFTRELVGAQVVCRESVRNVFAGMLPTFDMPTAEPSMSPAAA